MSDNLKLGQLIEEGRNPQRDAVHVAVVPVTAGTRLQPGMHVGFKDGDAETAWPITDEPRGPQVRQAVGIVDPFLTVEVYPGQRIWLYLYPGSITALRHDWTHPAFDSAVRDHLDVVAARLLHSRSDSVAWLRWFADEVGVTYEQLLDAAEENLKDGSYFTLGHSTPEAVYEKRREFWEHYEVVSGRKASDRDATFFSCAC